MNIIQFHVFLAAIALQGPDALAYWRTEIDDSFDDGGFGVKTEGTDDEGWSDDWSGGSKSSKAFSVQYHEGSDDARASKSTKGAHSIDDDGWSDDYSGGSKSTKAAFSVHYHEGSNDSAGSSKSMKNTTHSYHDDGYGWSDDYSGSGSKSTGYVSKSSKAAFSVHYDEGSDDSTGGSKSTGYVSKGSKAAFSAHYHEGSDDWSGYGSKSSKAVDYHEEDDDSPGGSKSAKAVYNEEESDNWSGGSGSKGSKAYVLFHDGDSKSSKVHEDKESVWSGDYEDADGSGEKDEDGEDFSEEVYTDEWWRDLPPDIQDAYAILGWDGASWDTGENPPPSEDMDWDELSEEMQEAASYIGYTQQTWDA